MHKTVTLLAMLGSLLGAVGHAVASSITYTEQTVGTGRLGSDSFTNALVSISFVGDTTNVYNQAPGVWVNSVGTAVVTVTGVSTASFTDTLGVFDQQAEQAFGIEDFAVMSDVLGLQDPAFASYDLTTPLGPFSSSAFLNPGEIFKTTVGGFSLTAAGDVTVTASAVPEPSSFLLLSLGLAGMARWRAKLSRPSKSLVQLLEQLGGIRGFVQRFWQCRIVTPKP